MTILSDVAVVTGITSFLGAHVALVFLKNGWTVRGTLRSDAKKADVLALPQYKPFLDKGTLQLHVTGPLEAADYTETLKNARVVIHVASPFAFGDREYRDTHHNPAVQGVAGVLRAAAEEQSIEHVVMTSTFGATGSFQGPPTEEVGKVYKDDDWNPWTTEDMDKLVSAKDKNQHALPDGYLFYGTGKKYAELEAWKVQKETGARWTLATMNCVSIFGPSIQPINSLSQGGISTDQIWQLLKGPKEAPMPPTFGPSYVDVRDAAEAHYQAAVRGAQGRFSISAGDWDYQEAADMARQWYPQLKDRIIFGQPGKYAYKDPGVYKVDHTKSEQELGIKYRPKEQTFKDAMDRILELEAQGLD